MAFSASIKISELDIFPGLLQSVDFFPIVDSSSLTTYRLDINGLNAWFVVSGSVASASYALSASWAPASLFAFVSYSISSSWASQSLQSVYSTQSLFATQSKLATSASWASSSISSSYAGTASVLLGSIQSSNFSISSSWASKSLQSYYSTQSLYCTQSIYSTASLQAISASWASSSISSSYALSCSFAPPTLPFDTMPIGSIIAFASGSPIPANWLECNGAVITQSAPYNLLYAAVKSGNSTAFGYPVTSTGATTGANRTYFALPNLKGTLPRGWDHSHNTFGTVVGGGSTSTIHTHGYSYWVTGGSNLTFATTDGASVTVPNAPTSLQLMYIIKYGNLTNFATQGSAIAGDVVGTLAASNVVKIQNVGISSAAPSNGNILTYNGTQWTPLAPATSQGIQAWAEITWGLNGVWNVPTLAKNSNIASITPLSNFTVSSWQIVQYGILFTTVVPSNNYTFIGQAGAPVAVPEVSPIFVNTTYGNRTVNGFTMSLAINTVTNNPWTNWFKGFNTSATSNQMPYVSFQIVGS